MTERTIEERLADLENRTSNLENAISSFVGQLRKYLPAVRSIEEVKQILLMVIGQFGGIGGKHN